MLLSQADPFPLRMRPWTARPDADRIAAQTQGVEDAILASGGTGFATPWTPLP